MKYYLAIDIGASSGRHILGYIKNEKLKLEEIHRFENYITNQNGTLVWDIKHLVDEVKKGIAKCKEIGKIPTTVAIDTWGVDYVLLDEDKQEIMPAISYRDSRTNRIIKEVESIISAEELYLKTGIQKQNFNTIYQLYADELSGKLDYAKHFLMIPAYLSYKLTGVIKNEYTNATTTSMVNAKSKTWDNEIIEKLGLPKHLFTNLDTPCTVIGNFTKEMQDYAGFDSTVIFSPSHDTASAVAACPIDDNSVYISSGTWSLIGVESLNPIVNIDAQKANFANEGGIDYRFRFLKNYMGMWLFQNVKKNMNNEFSYDNMMRLAMQSSLTVGTTEDDSISRMTISLTSDDKTFEQVKKQLNRCVEVIKVTDLTDKTVHNKELVFFKIIDCNEIEINELFKFAQVFSLSVVDYNFSSIILECVQSEDKNNSIIKLLNEKFSGRIEVVRGGSVAMESINDFNN